MTYNCARSSRQRKQLLQKRLQSEEQEEEQEESQEEEQEVEQQEEQEVKQEEEQEKALVANSSHTPHKAPASSSRITSSIGTLTEIWLKLHQI